jgi:hypothetical protein
VETQIARLLDERVKTEATRDERRITATVAPALRVQTFRLANGALRYYVRVEWKTGKEKALEYPYSLGAWITPVPTLHILAVEPRTSAGYAIEDGLPDLLNLVDLGAGKTGMILHLSGGESIALVLAEYRDGLATQKMRVLQSLSFGE